MSGLSIVSKGLAEDAMAAASRYLKGIAGLSVAVALLLVVSCGNRTSFQSSLPDLSKLTVDPLECTTIALKPEVHIGRQIVFEPSVMQGWVLMVFKYREGDDEKAYDPKLPSVYTNISVGVAAKKKTSLPVLILRDYSVVEIWKLEPTSKTKVCYLWTLSKYHASLRLMVENFGRTVLAEREVPLSDQQIARLKVFHNQLLAIFLKRVGNARASS